MAQIAAFPDPTLTPQSAGEDRLEVVTTPPAQGAALNWEEVPISGTIDLTPTGNIATFEAQATGTDGAWQYVAKTGCSWTLAFMTAAPENHPVVKALINAGLATDTATSMILIRVTRASGAVYSGALVVADGKPGSGRAIATTTFKGTGSGKLHFDI